MRPWSSAGHRADPFLAQPEHPAGDADGDVRLLAREHAQRRGAGKAVRLDVPPDVAQDRVSRRSQAGEVRHLASGDEADAAAGRQPEQLAHPPGGHLLGDRERRGGRVAAGVLIPGGGQPVGGDRDRQGAADDEAEIARAGRGDQPGLDIAR
jgi:hypothetical protein